jgi:hypothetical protein
MSSFRLFAGPVKICPGASWGAAKQLNAKACMKKAFRELLFRKNLAARPDGAARSNAPALLLVPVLIAGEWVRADGPTMQTPCPYPEIPTGEGILK